MKAQVITTALTLAVIAAAVPATADPAVCDRAISGSGKLSRVEGSEDFKRHHGKVPPRLAHDRAIDDWRAKVVAQCPSHSAIWLRGSRRKVVCEGKMGGEMCMATARPSRKLLSRGR